METINKDRKWVDELTTLEMALKIYDKDKFLAVKQGLLGSEFDREAQAKIWEDYHGLFRRAVLGRPEEGDTERLEYYYRLEGHYEILSYGSTKLYFPTNITRDASGNIIGATHNFLDNEITTRWFKHIHNILVGRSDVRMCTDEACSNFFIRKQRKDKRFCSDTCRKRAWLRTHHPKNS